MLEDVLPFSMFELPFQDRNIHRINTLLGIDITVMEERCMVELHFCGL